MSIDFQTKCMPQNKSDIHLQTQKPNRVQVLKKVGIGIGFAALGLVATALLAAFVAGIVFLAIPAIGVSVAIASGLAIGSGVALAAGAGAGGTALGVMSCFFKGARQVISGSMG